MTTITLSIAAIDAALSDLADQPAQFLQRRGKTGTAVFWLVAPADRARMCDPFWEAMKASPARGVWGSPEAALVGFAAGAKGWVARAASKRPGGVLGLLIDRLSAGPMLVTDLLRMAKADGISRDRLDRAARKLGVKRAKNGMGGGWMWTLPAELREQSASNIVNQATEGQAQ